MDVFTLICFNVYPVQESTSSFPIFESISLVIAIVAMYFPVKIYKFTKKKEIEYEKFKILAVENLNVYFQLIEKELDKTANDLKSPNSLRDLSSAITDLNLFVTTILSVEYQNINKQTITSKIDIFSDFILNNSQQRWKYEFQKIKFEILSELYDYAIKDKRFYEK